MDYLDYQRFLPSPYRDRSLPEPQSMWWPFNDDNIHLWNAPAPNARIRVLAVHGMGGHGGMLWPMTALAAEQGPESLATEPLAMEALAIDLPLYGLTRVSDPRSVRYADWIDLLCDLVVHLTETDDRPLILMGASMGGMLCYEVAARTGLPAHVVATNLIDPSDRDSRAAAARYPLLGVWGPAMLRVLDPMAGRIRMPVTLLADMAKMSVDPELSDLCARDPLGGGVRIPLGFVTDFLNFRHTRPEQYTGAPITLLHPAADHWTPPELSLRFLERVKVPHEVLLLEGCGHFPVEEPGLRQAVAALRELTDRVSGS